MKLDTYQLFSIRTCTVIFLPGRPASQTHDSHKGRMILNHESPAGHIKNFGEKSAFNFCNFRFECCFFLLAHRALNMNNIGKKRYQKTPQQYSDHYLPWETCFQICTAVGEFTSKSQYRLPVKTSADKPLLIILPTRNETLE